MNIVVQKSNGRAPCRHFECAGNPEYINSKGKITKGTICAIITIDSAGGYNSSYYCRDCIDKIYLQVKTSLNSKLWAFK